MIFYEAVHRVCCFFEECQQVFGSQRRMVVARELTKQFESIVRGSVEDIIAYFKAHQDQVRGEFVILMEGVDLESQHDTNRFRYEQVLFDTTEECSTSTAATLAAKLFGGKSQNAELSLYEKRIKIILRSFLI